MRKYFSLPVFILLFISMAHLPAYCEKDPGTPQKGYRVLIPAGKTQDNLPVLKPLIPGDPRFSTSKYLFENTFMSESVWQYQVVQQYLVNSGEKKEVEPAYLLLSGRQGGFPMLGFYLLENGKISNKKTTWYIDMMALDKDPATLSSLTQIFPHEMGHVFFSLLAPETSKNYDASSIDMHFYSITTNYLTAFNEGFAEHFENASRFLEKNATIKAGIEKNTRKLADRLPGKIKGLDKDFRCPLRLGYYRAGLLLWYQGFEDYKRYQWAVTGKSFHKNRTLSSGTIEKNILYRNAGLGVDETNVRNTAQLASNEGVINTFFTRLLQSEVKLGFQPRAFYLPFLADTTGFVPEKRFTQVQNFYLKLFTVLHRQMNHPAGDTSFFQLFIASWERQFPEEKPIIEKVYRETTGTTFALQPLPEIWLMNENQEHSMLVMDQYGGNALPFYTLNLNTADEEDFSGFAGISREEIRSLIRYRDQNLGFHSVNELNRAGLKGETIRILDEAHQLISNPSKKMDEGGMSISNIFIYNGGHILLIGLIYFGIFWILFYILFMRNKYSPGKIILISVQKLLKLYLLILAGLACFMFLPLPVLPFLGLVVCILVIDGLKTRKNNVKRREVILTTLFLSALVIYSLI